jgi:Flp pilus assembly protein TadD
MKLVLAAAVVFRAISVTSSQVPPSRAVPERDRAEALQRYRFGQDALRSERFDVAEQEFQKAAKLDPTLELAPYGLGKVYMATKRYRQAVVAYQKCEEVFQANQADAVGDDVARQRRVNDVIKALEDERRRYSQMPGRNANSPASLANIQQLDMQITQMKGLRLRSEGGREPTPPWITIALGSAYFRTESMTDAEREYRAAIAVDPKIGEAHNNLAVVLMLSSRYKEAEEEIRAAEGAGFKVNPQLKEDLKAAAKR